MPIFVYSVCKHLVQKQFCVLCNWAKKYKAIFLLSHWKQRSLFPFLHDSISIADHFVRITCLCISGYKESFGVILGKKFEHTIKNRVHISVRTRMWYLCTTLTRMCYLYSTSTLPRLFQAEHSGSYSSCSCGFEPLR